MPKNSIVAEEIEPKDGGAVKFEPVTLQVKAREVPQTAEQIAAQHQTDAEAQAAKEAHDKNIGERKDTLSEQQLEDREEAEKHKGKFKIKLKSLGRVWADCVQWVYDQYHFKDNPKLTLNDLMSIEELDAEHKALDESFSEMVENRLSAWSQYGDVINVAGEVLISFGTRVARATQRRVKNTQAQGNAPNFGSQSGMNSGQVSDFSMTGEEARRLLGKQ